MTKYLNLEYDLESEEMADLFDEFPIWSAPFGLKLLDAIRFKKNIRVLDIGFGAGFPLTEVAMRLGDSCEVFGIDPWQSAVKRARRKIEFYGITNIQIIDGVAEDIPLESESVDLIVSNNGINNVPDLEKTFSECSRVMKPGGQLVQSVNLENTMIEFYNVFSDVLLDLNMQEEVGKMQNHIYEKRKPLAEFLSLHERNGFKILNVENDSFEYKFNDGTTFLNHYFIRVAFLDSWKKIVPENKQKEIFSEVEERINHLTLEKGFFSLSIPFVIIDCEKE